MSQGSNYPYCDTGADLQNEYKDIENYGNIDTLATWTIASGQSNTYEKRNTGYYGAVFQNGSALTSRASIALVEANASSFFYDESNDILYVSMDDGADPDTADTITAGIDDWDGFKTTMRNNAMEIVESFLDPQYPRPLPFAKNSYNTAKYDADIRRATALMTCSLIVMSRDPDSSLGERLKLRVWNSEEESGILFEYSTHVRAFSFETTKDEFKGNIEVLTLDSNSTGRIGLMGNPDLIGRKAYRIKFTTAGVPETAKFQFSSDGGLTYTTSDSNSTFENWFHLIGGLYIRCTGTFVVNDEFEIQVADDREEVKTALGSFRVNTSGY